MNDRDGSSMDESLFSSSYSKKKDDSLDFLSKNIFISNNFISQDSPLTKFAKTKEKE